MNPDQKKEKQWKSLGALAEIQRYLDTLATDKSRFGAKPFMSARNIEVSGSRKGCKVASTEPFAQGYCKWCSGSRINRTG